MQRVSENDVRKKGDYVRIARKYAKDVSSGKITACKWVKLACKRQIDDLERQKSQDWQYKFSTERAEDICYFIELLSHIKGKWAGSLIVLQPWQIFILTTLFGWINKQTGNRRFRISHIEVARKNGKSLISSAVALYMLCADGEMGAEIYSAATNRDQAKIVFSVAQEMARKSPDLREAFGLQVLAHSCVIHDTASKFEALSADANSLDGLNTHLGVIDELHAHRTRKVYDVIQTSLGARAQPLLFVITTAGFDLSGVCYEKHNYAKKVLEGTFVDESFFPIIYTLDEEDDWRDPKNWIKANPNLEAAGLAESLEIESKQAIAVASNETNYLTKRLNVWVNAGQSWMPVWRWNQCADNNLNIMDFAGMPCIIAADLARKIDMAALSIVFYDEKTTNYYTFFKYYLPEETILGSSNSQYSGWVKQGRLTETGGATIDFDWIENDIKWLSETFRVMEFAYDPYQASQLSQNLAAEGHVVVEMRQAVQHISEPMKELESLIYSKRLYHDGCPIAEWMISNVVAKFDRNENMMPDKERGENKIDGIIALIMAIGRWIKRDKDVPSVYETRGLRRL